MNLSEKSWHAKLYYLTFGEDSNLPNNLCPYFWKLVLCLIIFIPFSLWYFLLFIFYFVRNIIQDEGDYISEDGYLSEQFIFATMCNLVIFLLFCMAYVWLMPLTSKFNSFQAFGIIGYVLLLIGAFIAIREYWKEHRPYKRPTEEEYKEPRPSILIEFIKAKYNRYCPKIDWDKK